MELIVPELITSPTVDTLISTDVSSDITNASLPTVSVISASSIKIAGAPATSTSTPSSIMISVAAWLSIVAD